ncbi:Copper chaperone [Handroanthus impetiginosus]|uniref:Copper chaperone n=1 Tax=Handroanthus impetiginosus TaxID=429701 RepID=A0A2G9HEB2_9LAMI|nr:Copper chaperone [Handroanthus impetiginosus]
MSKEEKKVEEKKVQEKKIGEKKVEEKKDGEKKDGEKKVEVITAVYKAHLHCPKCADDIKKPLLKLPGVHRVDTKFEKGEITVKGAIDAKKIHAKIQKWSKKKVELISETKSKEEAKKETIKTITMKTYLHCDQCEKEARRRLILHKGIYNVKTNIKAQTITVEGAIEPEKLTTYMRKRVHKYAEIVPEKKASDKKLEEKKEGDKKLEEKKEGDKKLEEKKEKIKVDEVKSGDKVVEFKEVKIVEVKTKEGEVPYFIHYVYAPQLFSDENPNACSIL